MFEIRVTVLGLYEQRARDTCTGMCIIPHAGLLAALTLSLSGSALVHGSNGGPRLVCTCTSHCVLCMWIG